MSNLIGKSVIVNDSRLASCSATVIDQNDKRNTVTVLDENDDCFELSIDQITLDLEAA